MESPPRAEIQTQSISYNKTNNLPFIANACSSWKKGGRHEHSIPTTTYTIDGVLNWREVVGEGGGGGHKKLITTTINRY